MKKIKRNTTYFALWLLVCFSASSVQSSDQAPEHKDVNMCPEFMNQNYRELHGKDMVSLCEKSGAKALLVVNTASHCGYTPQFKELELLHQRYGAKGLATVGFSSNDFNQESKDEAESAGICFKNFGVTFTMLAPTKVTGDDANPTFKYLNTESAEPRWNFNKYLVDLETGAVKQYGSRVKPLGSELESQIVSLLGSDSK